MTLQVDVSSCPDMISDALCEIARVKFQIADDVAAEEWELHGLSLKPIPKPLVDSSVERLRFDNIDMAKWLAIEARQEPVLIEAGTTGWNAELRWTLQGLEQHYGDRSFSCGEDADGQAVRVRLNAFLAYMRSNCDDAPLYVFDQDFVAQAPDMAFDYTVPQIFRDIELQKELKTVARASDFPPHIRYKASRAMGRKLSCYDAKVVKQARNAETQSVADFVTAHYADAEAHNANVLNSFWTDTVAIMFGLNMGSWKEKLPQPAEDIDDDDLFDAELGPLYKNVHGNNPSLRVPAVSLIERRLEIAGPLPRFQIRAMACYSLEGPNCTSDMSHRLLIAFLSWAAKNKLPEQWPEFWREVQGALEQKLVEQWETLRIDLHDFVDRYFAAVCCFLCRDDLRMALDATKNKTNCDTLILNRLLDTNIGAALFQEEAHKAQWKSFLDSCARWLTQFCSVGWKADDVSRFQQEMGKQTRQLILTGRTHITKSTQSFSYVGFSFGAPITSLDDFWEAPNYLMLSAVCINGGRVCKYPWEHALLGDSKIKDVPEHVVVDEPIYTNLKIARNIVKEVCIGYHTVDEWVMQLRLKETRERISRVNNFWNLDFEFLSMYVKPYLTAKVESMMQDAVVFDEPSDADLQKITQWITEQLKKVRSGIVALQCSEAVQALGNNGQHILDRSVDIIREVVGMNAPGHEVISKYSSVELAFLAKLEDAVKIRPVTPTQNNLRIAAALGVVVRGDGQIISGKEALALYYQKAHRLHSDPAQGVDGTTLLHSLDILFMFRWILTPDQSKQLDEWKAEDSQKAQAQLALALVPLAGKVKAPTPVKESSKKTSAGNANRNNAADDDDGGEDIEAMFKPRRRKLA